MSRERDQRVAEASALRELFSEQWRYLSNRIERYAQRRRSERGEAEGLNRAVEEIVEGTDSRLRAVGGYQKRLRRGTGMLLEYLDNTLDGLSRVVEINRTAYTEDPLVNSLFRSPDQIRSVISRSPQIYAHTEKAQGGRATFLYLLLMLARQEKTVLGSALRGNLVVRDVQQTSVRFHSHRIIAVTHSESLIRAALKRMVFNNVIGHIRGHMTMLRHGITSDSGRRLRPGAAPGVETPWRYIEELERLLALPRELIRTRNNCLYLDSMGIKLPEDNPTNGRRLSFDELQIGDGPSQIVLIGRYPLSEVPAQADPQLFPNL